LRPKPVVAFEAMNLTTLAVGVVHSIFVWDESVAIASPAFVITIQAFSIGLVLMLTLLVSRRRSNVAKWVLIVLFLIGLPGVIVLLANGLALGSPIITVFQTVLQAVGICLLFTPPARRWFRGDDVESMRQTFA
jgi:hypothetical protein